MPLHEKLSEEAEARLISDKKRRFWGALSIAVFVLVLLCLVLAAYFVIAPSKDPVKVKLITLPPDQPPADNSKKDRQKRPPSRPQPPSHIPLQDMVRTKSQTDVTIPPPIDDSLPGPTMNHEADLSPGLPGDETKMIDKLIGDENGTGLTGTFYDLKQTQGGRPTGLSPAATADILKDFVTAKNWNEQHFAKYYQSPVKLRNPFFFIPRMKATAAPEAFGCGDKVKDSRWVAIYRGKVKVPVSGSFRFVGAGDDAIVVRFNNKVVFDYGWYQLTQGKIASSASWRDAMKNASGNESLKKELRKARVNVPPVTF